MNKKRILTALLAAIMVMSLMSACQSASPSSSTPSASVPSTSTPATSGSTSTPAPEPEPPYVITMLAPFYQQEPPKLENNPVFDFVQEQTNVKLELIYTPNGELENKFNVMMAGNDMTMIMNGCKSDSSSFLRMASTGAFWDITEIIKDYPYITETLMSPVQVRMSLTEGKRYLIPFNTPDGRIGMVYREDWVESLGITLPEILTAQDFYDLCKAFTEGDPDGNNVKDTTGFAYVDDQNQEVNYGFNTVAVMLGAPNHWGYRDGKAVPYFDTQEYMDTLNYLRDMYQNGYLGEDFATLGSGAKYNPMLEGRAGIMFTTATNAVVPGGKYDTLIATNPNAKIGYKLLNLDPNGNKVVNSNITAVGAGGIVLTTAKVKTEDDVRRILQFFVDAQTGDCAKAIDIGIEGKHYSLEGGKITVTKEQEELRVTDGSKEIFGSIIPRRVMEEDWGQPLTPTQEISRKFIETAKYAVPDISIGLMSADSLALQKELEPYIIDARVQYIMGRIDEAAFKAAVQTWKDGGGQQIIDEVTANYIP